MTLIKEIDDAPEQQGAQVADGFVTLHDVFHPESAEPTLATAVREQQIAENKWSAVWAEATLVVPEDEATVAQQEDDVKTGVASDGEASSKEGGAAVSTATTVSSQQPPWRKSHFFDFVFGVSFTIAAVSSTVGIEITAGVVFVIAVGSYRIADFFKRKENIFMIFWYSIFHLVYAVLSMSDVILITLSVFVAEVLAGVGWMLTALAGDQGSQWHQYIRKICHLTRWAFRDFHSTWKDPKRIYPFGPEPIVADNDEDDNKEEVEVDIVVAQEVTAS